MIISRFLNFRNSPKNLKNAMFMHGLGIFCSGNVFMKKYYTIFDVETFRIGIGKIISPISVVQEIPDDESSD